jgi:hypothetical protein
MNRNYFTPVKNQKYLTNRLYRFPKRSSDRYIITRESDRLDLLAKEFYGNEKLWWILADTNNLGKGNLNTPSGIQLRIPFPLTNVFDRLRDANGDR